MAKSRRSITVLTTEGPVHFDQPFAVKFDCRSVEDMLGVYRIVTGCDKRRNCIAKFNGLNNVLKTPVMGEDTTVHYQKH